MKVEPCRVRFVDEGMQTTYASLRHMLGEPVCCQVDRTSQKLHIKWVFDGLGLAQRYDVTAEAGAYRLIDNDTARRLLERVHPDTSHLSDACALLASPEPLCGRA